MSLLVFVHVPRTAGTTLTRVIRDRYPADRVLGFDDPARVEETLVAMSPEARDELEAVVGHVHYGVHRLFDRPVQYVTMLRHPAARIASHYRFVRATPRHYLHHEVVGTGHDLASYARGELSDELRDGQVRMFSPSGSLDEAQRVLAEEFDVVGLTERFDESLLLMQDALGWTTPYYSRENRTSSGAALTDEELAAIEAANPRDFALYGFAEKLLEQRIGAKDGFPERVERFRRRNRILAPALKLRRAWRRFA